MESRESYDLSQSFVIGRAISNGIEALKRQPLGMIIGAVLIAITGGGSPGGGGNLNANSNGLDEAQIAMLATMVGCGLCCGLVMAVIRAWLEPGWYRLHRAIATTGEAELGVLFSGTDAFVPSLIYKVIHLGIGMGVFAISSLPGAALMGVGYTQDQNMVMIGVGAALWGIIALPVCIYVEMGLLMGGRIIGLDGMQPMEALSQSWAMARGNRITLFLFVLVTGLFAALGLLACCIGVIPTSAIAQYGFTDAYLRATRDDMPEDLHGFTAGSPA